MVLIEGRFLQPVFIAFEDLFFGGWKGDGLFPEDVADVKEELVDLPKPYVEGRDCPSKAIAVGF